MAKEIFTELFNYYDISRNDDKKNRRIRKVIKERLSKAYPSREWDDLTDLEKQTFKLVTMKDYLIKVSKNEKKTEQKIKDELEKTLYNANKALIAHNDYIDTIYRQFFDADASEKENYNYYLEFCEKINQYFPSETPPTFQEWIIHPLRLYDVMMSSIWNKEPQDKELQSYEPEPVTQSQIDHIVLKCILLILKRNFNYDVDISSIKHCLEMTNDIDFLNTETLQATIDPMSNVPVEEQNKRISINLEIMESLRKLSNLNDFIVEK